jgi:catechol 2,3-dioxygenase-like lactoylglutathione lyase family enzyme
MAIQRMDHVGVVVSDLDAAIAFFTELGMELAGQTPARGPWVDRIVGLEGVSVDIAMMQTPDGHGRLELTKFHQPAAFAAGSEDASNALGLRNVMFAVDDLDDVLARLRGHGGELIGEVTQFEQTYRLCYVRGPEKIIVALAEEITGP